MTYIIAEPCVGLKDGACIDVCPVDCIYEGDDMMYINPEECIDCAACEPVCPVTAIFPEDTLPEEWQSFIPLNYNFDYANTPPATSRSSHQLLGMVLELTPAPCD